MRGQRTRSHPRPRHLGWRSRASAECSDCHRHVPSLAAQRDFGFPGVIRRFGVAVLQKVQDRAVLNITKTTNCVIFSHAFQWDQVCDGFWTCTSLAERKICSK